MAKKVVVTGGAGFIGSHLAEELQNRGHYVIVLDNFSTGKRANIDRILKKNSVEFVEGSVTDLALLQTLFKETEYVFHQAALARVPFSIENPLAANEVNITGTLNVLLAARDNKVKKVVFASSSSIYGDTDVLPQHEAMYANPLSPYALTKLAGEYYCSIFRNIFKLDTICLRYFNVYGPRQDPHSQYAMVIPAFISRVLAGTPPVIFGDGEQSRDFTFIHDVVNANIRAAESDVNGVFNVGGGKNITINQLAQLIIKLLQKDLGPVYDKPRLGDVKHTLADVSKAKVFGYKPEWSLEDGLKKIIADSGGES